MGKLNALRVVLLLFVCTFSQFVLFAQVRKISGTIKDDKGVPVSGATVTIKGTNVAAATNAQGVFSLNLPQNANTLIITHVGMEKKTIVVGSGNVVEVSLTPTATTLSDVVVVGYGTSRKANLTTAQSTVSAKDIEKTVNTTLEQAIQGRAAGVYVTQNSGQPGGGISVAIRGLNTINGTNQPLYVIDGVQIQPGTVSYGAASSTNALAGLNPSDIESIEILQGPSATAVYGSRATNGVV